MLLMLRRLAESLAELGRAAEIYIMEDSMAWTEFELTISKPRGPGWYSAMERAWSRPGAGAEEAYPSSLGYEGQKSAGYTKERREKHRAALGSLKQRILDTLASGPKFAAEIDISGFSRQYVSRIITEMNREGSVHTEMVRVAHKYGKYNARKISLPAVSA